MNPWGELVVGSLLWSGIIAGLIHVVRDCLKDRHHELTFLEDGEDECQGCGGVSSVEILTHKCQES